MRAAIKQFGQISILLLSTDFVLGTRLESGCWALDEISWFSNKRTGSVLAAADLDELGCVSKNDFRTII